MPFLYHWLCPETFPAFNIALHWNCSKGRRIDSNIPKDQSPIVLISSCGYQTYAFMITVNKASFSDILDKINHVHFCTHAIQNSARHLFYVSTNV